MFLLTLILFSVCCPCEEALKIVKFEVPGLVSEGSDVELSCMFELSGYKLYSVKWYKDDTEFYSFTPRYTPPVQVFHTDGVDIHLNKSQVGSIYLQNVRPASEGIYKCEVSGESPDFPIEYETKEMKIYVAPKHGPVISGYSEKYRIGETIRLNCTSAKSKPGVKLFWFINDKRMQSRLLEFVATTKDEDVNFDDSVVSVSVIQFRLQPDNTTTEMEVAKAGKMTLTCSSFLPENIKDVPKHVQNKFHSNATLNVVFSSNTLTLSDARLPGTPFTSSSSEERNVACQSSSTTALVVLFIVCKSLFESYSTCR